MQLFDQRFPGRRQSKIYCVRQTVLPDRVSRHHFICAFLLLI